MKVEILAVAGIGEVDAGADLAALIADHAPSLRDGDVLVVTSKVVSKAEGRVVGVDRESAIDAETVRVVARRGETRISQTRHGFVMAAAGVDASNVRKGEVALLPLGPDASARRIRAGLQERLGVTVGVVISDSFGRPWRVGLTDAAVGVAGLEPLDDLRGEVDTYGNDLRVTITCIADEIAAAADLVKGKLRGVPVAIVRGLTLVKEAAGNDENAAAQGISAVVRPAQDDMFPLGSRDVIPARRDATSFAPGALDAAALKAAITTASLAAAPDSAIELSFVDVTTSKDIIAPLTINPALVRAAAGVLVPVLAHQPQPQQLLAAGAAIENVLIALAVDRIASRWLWSDPTALRAATTVSGYPIGLVALGHEVPASGLSQLESWASP